jgi:phage-related protein
MQIILLYFHINLMSRVLNNLKILQTDQMGRVVNHLDTIQFSIKKASQLVKEIGRQVCNLIWTYVDLSFLA